MTKKDGKNETKIQYRDEADIQENLIALNDRRGGSFLGFTPLAVPQ